MIDLDKAEALLRAEGLFVQPYYQGVTARDHLPEERESLVTCSVDVRDGRAIVEVWHDRYSPDEADALIAALTRLAALCRRIEAECQVTSPSAGPVCSTCGDTHSMYLPSLEREVPRTRCPTPCARCRGGRSAYCRATPCGCSCHVAVTP